MTVIDGPGFEISDSDDGNQTNGNGDTSEASARANRTSSDENGASTDKGSGNGTNDADHNSGPNADSDGDGDGSGSGSGTTTSSAGERASTSEAAAGNGNRSNGGGTSRPMSRKAKKRAAARARREAAAKARAEAEATEESAETADDTNGDTEHSAAPEADETTADMASAEAENTPADTEPAETDGIPADTEPVEADKTTADTEPVEADDTPADTKTVEADNTATEGETVKSRETPTETRTAEAAHVRNETKPDAGGPVVLPQGPTEHLWSANQLLSIAQRTVAVVVIIGLVGYGLGFLRGGGSTARAEFVYTLDESVPDSFLREDRRLLTQVVTFKSDAVLTPVAAANDLTVEELRARIDIETLNLSEVLRLDVRDADPERAVALNRAVLDRYLQVISEAAPADTGDELTTRRTEIAAELEQADASRRALLEAQEQDVTLQLQQESLQRRIEVKTGQVGDLQANLDAAILEQGDQELLDVTADTLGAAEADLANLEAELLAVGAERAELATATTAEPALLREIDRLEAKLATIDDELAERELAPLVAAPIRELSEPIVLSTSRHFGGIQGMAIGVLAALPIAALVAIRTRRRQLWFG
ncbi:MAG: hypothetical protein AAF531_24700 [Actinomycetota bacterium]